MRKPKLVAPTPNLNGTSRSELVQQYLAVSQTTHDLLRDMRSCAPHGRDYPMSPVDLGLARDAHLTIYTIVSDIESQYLNVAIELTHGEY